MILCPVFEALDSNTMGTKGEIMLTNISKKINESLIMELSEGEDVGTIGAYCEDGFPLYYANNKIAHMLGYEDVDDLIAGIHGKAANIIDPDDLERVFKELNDGGFHEGMTYKVICRMPKKDGTSIWTVNKGKVICTEDGRLVILSICKDMTAFIDRYEELECLNQLSKSTLDNMPGGYHRCAAEQGYPFIYISDRFCEMFGWTREEIKTKFDNQFINMLHPEDIASTKKYVELLNHNSNKNAVDAIYRMKGKNGYIWVSNAASSVTIGNQTFYQGTLTDITGFVVERIKQDELLREQWMIFDSIARHFKNVYWLDLEKKTVKILKLDAAYAGVLGKVDQQERSFKAVVEKWIQTMVCPEDREKVRSAVKIENIKKVFETQEELVGNYRSFVNGEIHYFQYNFIRTDKDGTKAVVGFQNIDNIIEEHAKADQIEREKEAAHQREMAESYEKLNAMHEIIAASRMATWNIYLLDGKAPRMEADHLMLELLGVAEKERTPEQVYDAWFTNISPSSLQSVLHSVEKMKKEGRDENTYLWNHPVLGERYVRCGGTAKPVEGGFVLRGYHYDVDEVVREQKKKDQALIDQIAIIDTLAQNFKNVFVANLKSGMARVVRLAEDYDVKAIMAVMEKDFPYEPVVKQWIKENVYENDKKKVEKAFSFENLCKVFSVQNEFSGTYRSIEGGKLHHYQFDFRKADNSGNVVAGFQVIDAIVEEHEQQAKRERELEDARLSQEREHAEVVNSLSTIYSTIFSADIDTCQYQILTSVPLMGEVAKSTGNFNDVKDEILNSFMVAEFQDSMREFLDFNTLAERLKSVNTITTEYKAPTGQWMQSRIIVKRRAANGIAKEVLYVARDITKEKLHDLKQQEALAQALAAAQQANRAKTTFLNSMSHDIRTPMNAIVGFTALAQTHSDDQAQVQDYLSKISTSSTHLLSLINDILDMSRIESGTVKLEEKAVHIPDLIHDLRTMIQSLIHSKNLNLFIDTQDVVHEDVLTDKLRLNQVLLNIVGNAIKFTQPGGDIMIRLIEKPCNLKNYTTYEFSVKDNGIGMSKDFVGHIFDTFSREYTSTVSGIQGTGLGMAITKNIVDMMGGDIRVESEEGKGSLFTVTLNMRIGNAFIKNEPIPELLGAKALVVDDNMDTCRSVSKMLRDIQMRPDWTTSGKEAIVRAQDAADMMDEYKVYIIDYLMPDMNGIETVRQLRKVISEEVPIIVLTAYDWADFEWEARQAGVTAFVSKPIFMSELRTVLTQPVIKEGIENLEREKEKKGSYDYSGKRVLLVEDNELNREIATAILEEIGVMVDSAEDGDIAVSTINNAPADRYDLIFMDIQMPKMDGYTATREIRTLPDNQKANIPIIAMTANAFEDDRRKSYEYGMNGHIIKPISIEEIVNVLDEILVR